LPLPPFLPLLPPCLPFFVTSCTGCGDRTQARARSRIA
jgi:hypothetical protein